MRERTTNTAGKATDLSRARQATDLRHKPASAEIERELRAAMLADAEEVRRRAAVEEMQR